MILGDYELVNEDKVTRAIFGTVNSRGTATGGVGEDAPEEAKLAEYDRLGGLIRYKGDNVKMGSFYDFPGKKPFADPIVMLQFNINGHVVDVPATEQLPPMVRAAKLAEQGVEEEKETEAPKPARRTRRAAEETE